MADVGAQLSSVATALDDLTKRVTEVADSYSGTPRDDVALDLYDVERSLRVAIRRLERVTRQL